MRGVASRAACRTAAAAAGKTPSSDFVATVSFFPRGCYYYPSSDIALFNPHADGAGHSYAQLLCAAVTTGAPRACPLGYSQGYSQGYSRSV